VLFAVVALLAIATVPLTGGRLGRLAEVRFRAPALAIGGLAAQVLIVSVLSDVPRGVAVVVHLASYAAVLAFVWCNRSLPGLWFIGLGGLSNLIAISANRGVMPASAHALRVAGRSAHEQGFTNSEVVAHPHLAFLGDVVPLPSPMPLANVLSIGDLLIAVGLFVLVHSICRGRGEPATHAVSGPSPQ
jgi:hypothetical protein